MKPVGGNALVMKEINTNLVRHVLKARKQATAQQIAQATALSVVTVGAVLQELAAQGEIKAGELVPSGGGRPAQSYRYDFAYAYALIMFPDEWEGRMTLRHAVVDLAGTPVYESSVPVAHVDLASLTGIAAPLIERYPTIGAVGIGHPGVESGGRIIVSDCELLLGTSPVSYFESLYQLPATVENDVNCAAVGFGAGKGHGTLVYLYFPDRRPPGAGVIIDGKLYKGKGSFAGEVKSIPLGVVWGPELYRSFDAFCDAAARLVAAICSLINPELVVLNGSFIGKSHIASVLERCHRLLPPEILPMVFLSDTFTADYQWGLTVRTLGLLDSGLALIDQTEIKG